MSERATKARGADIFSLESGRTTFYESAKKNRKLATHDRYCVRTLCSSEHASPGGGTADLPSLSGSHPCSCDKEGARQALLPASRRRSPSRRSTHDATLRANQLWAPTDDCRSAGVIHRLDLGGHHSLCDGIPHLLSSEFLKFVWSQVRALALPCSRDVPHAHATTRMNVDLELCLTETRPRVESKLRGFLVIKYARKNGERGAHPLGGFVSFLWLEYF
jgi:hypothetical protein